MPTSATAILKYPSSPLTTAQLERCASINAFFNQMNSDPTQKGIAEKFNQLFKNTDDLRDDFFEKTFPIGAILRSRKKRVSAWRL